MSKPATLLRPARRLFYELGGPWHRCRMFEALGSYRFSHPALFDMDRRLAAIIPTQGGVFVEAGAHDGYTQSNTYFLERLHGWSVVLVEPIPQLRERCARRRPRAQVFGCALVGPERDGEPVEIYPHDLMSSIVTASTSEDAAASAHSIRVPGRTISSVLEEAGTTHIDLLVLDLEGAELEAIAGLDRTRHTPRYVLVEALDAAAQKPALDAALADTYEFAQGLSDYDLLYQRRG